MGHGDATSVAEDERTLIHQAKRGDVHAYEQLYRGHVGRVYGLCLRMTGGNVETAEDCTQDAFIQAWHRLASFEGRSRFGTWLHRIAVNAVLARHRREREWASLDDVEQVVPAEPVGIRMDLEEAIRSLPEGARRVFVLRGVYGYSHEEIATLLGVATGTCKAQYHRARQLLRSRLGE